MSLPKSERFSTGMRQGRRARMALGAQEAVGPTGSAGVIPTRSRSISQATATAQTEMRPRARIAACSWCPMEAVTSMSTAGAQAVALERKGNWVDLQKRQHRRANLLLHCKHVCANVLSEGEKAWQGRGLERVRAKRHVPTRW